VTATHGASEAAQLQILDCSRPAHFVRRTLGTGRTAIHTSALEKTMPTLLGEIDLEPAAKQAAGNWMSFECFCWDKATELADAENWAIVYTHQRDSGLLDQSNAAAIEKALEPFLNGNDVVAESHSHWLVGWIDGFSIRVVRNGEITEAFQTYHELRQRLDDYPILDETDYSNREHEATVENIGEAAWRLKREFDLPDDWQSDVYEWFSKHNEGAIDDTDDQGGWPSEEELEEAFASLGYARIDE